VKGLNVNLYSQMVEHVYISLWARNCSCTLYYNLENPKYNTPWKSFETLEIINWKIYFPSTAFDSKKHLDLK
jgi:hypothetical protein